MNHAGDRAFAIGSGDGNNGGRKASHPNTSSGTSAADAKAHSSSKHASFSKQQKKGQASGTGAAMSAGATQKQTTQDNKHQHHIEDVSRATDSDGRTVITHVKRGGFFWRDVFHPVLKKAASWAEAKRAEKGRNDFS